MGIYSIKPKFQKKLRFLEDIFVNHNIGPTAINLLGLISSVVTAVAIYFSHDYAYLLLLVPFTTTFRTACNALDGLVSRRMGVASSFGEVLNEFIDRVSDTLIFGSVILLSATNDLLGVATLIVILWNSYLSILSKAAGGSRQYGGVMGKADRMIYISVAAVLVFATGKEEIWNYFLWFTIIGTAITLVQRFITTKNELKKD